MSRASAPSTSLVLPASGARLVLGGARAARVDVDAVVRTSRRRASSRRCVGDRLPEVRHVVGELRLGHGTELRDPALGFGETCARGIQVPGVDAWGDGSSLRASAVPNRQAT